MILSIPSDGERSFATNETLSEYISESILNASEPTEEKWNENVTICSDCGIKWKKIGKSCPVCFAPPEPTELK